MTVIIVTVTATGSFYPCIYFKASSVSPLMILDPSDPWFQFITFLYQFVCTHPESLLVGFFYLPIDQMALNIYSLPNYQLDHS